MMIISSFTANSTKLHKIWCSLICAVDKPQQTVIVAVWCPILQLTQSVTLLTVHKLDYNWIICCAQVLPGDSVLMAEFIEHGLAAREILVQRGIDRQMNVGQVYLHALPFTQEILVDSETIRYQLVLTSRFCMKLQHQESNNCWRSPSTFLPSLALF